MHIHPDSGHMALEITRHNAKTVEEGDGAAWVLLCWAFLLVLASLTPYWWPL